MTFSSIDMNCETQTQDIETSSWKNSIHRVVNTVKMKSWVWIRQERLFFMCIIIETEMFCKQNASFSYSTIIEIEIGSDECEFGIESWISIDRKWHVLQINFQIQTFQIFFEKRIVYLTIPVWSKYNKFDHPVRQREFHILK